MINEKILKMIDFLDTYVKIEPLNKGWSTDKKFIVETAEGKKRLLRVADIAEHNRKKAEYEMIERAYSIGVLTPEPIAFGFCNDGQSVYSLFGWIEGEDTTKVLPYISDAEQYDFGIKAGETLKKIHTLPAPVLAEPWDIWFWRKVQDRINFYNANPIKSDCGNLIVRYLQENRHLLQNRPQTFNHGDFNVTNMIITPENHIGVIDFNYYNKDHGDPWWEFDPPMYGWGSEPLAHFYTGLLKGYFDGEPPREFFTIFSFYQAYDALAALCDTSMGEQGKPEDGRRHLSNILKWFNNMQNPIPAWYLKDLYIQWVDGVPFKLKEPFDFSFIGKYGKVFKVFDNSSSGCICFGTEKDGKRYFIKFAGASTVNYVQGLLVEDAVVRLKIAAPKYYDLAHEYLIHFIKEENVRDGFALVFEWYDGESVGEQDPNSREKFHGIPVQEKVRIFEAVLDFHAHVAKKRYVAMDFNNNSVLYNFENGGFKICDIDFYIKEYYMNGFGRTIGDDNLLSPEEKRPAAIVDEVTNVYTMGAAAFWLLARSNRSQEAWPLSTMLYAVAAKAVSDERGKRQQSIEHFIAEWKAAKMLFPSTVSP